MLLSSYFGSFSRISLDELLLSISGNYDLRVHMADLLIFISGGRGGGDRGGGRGGSFGGRGGGGRGAPRGGGGRGGARGGAKVILEPHRHPGVFIAKGKEHLLVTKNLVPGESVYGEKRISIDGAPTAEGDATKTEYRVWNPFRSKLAAGILGGLDDIFIKPGAKVLYLGAASGTSVSHVADVVGPVCLCALHLVWKSSELTLTLSV